MADPIEILQWLAGVARDSQNPQRRDALWNGLALWRLAVGEGVVPDGPQGGRELAGAIAELYYDGWLTWDYQAHHMDPDPPPLHAFGFEHLQRCDKLRLTPEGWQALSSMKGQSEPTSGRPNDRAEAPVTSVVPEPSGRKLFISHASEDKSVVRELVRELQRRQRDLWFDELELKLGDSLRKRIDQGLSECGYGVVVLSENFFAKDWPQNELDGLLARETSSGKKVILPVWHGIDRAGVERHSPILAGRYAARTSDGIERVVDQIEAALEDAVGAGAGSPAAPSEAAGEPPQHRGPAARIRRYLSERLPWSAGLAAVLGGTLVAIWLLASDDGTSESPTANEAASCEAVTSAGPGPAPSLVTVPGSVERGDIFRAGLTEEGGYEDPLLTPPDSLVWFRMQIHNTGEASLSDVRVKVVIPRVANGDLSPTAIASSINAHPESASDTASINVEGDAVACVSYVRGSTTLSDNNKTVIRRLPDGITQAGVGIGNVGPRLEDARFVTFRVRITRADEAETSEFSTPVAPSGPAVGPT